MPRPRFARSSAARLTTVPRVQVDSVTTAPRPIRCQSGEGAASEFCAAPRPSSSASPAQDSAERQASRPTHGSRPGSITWPTQVASAGRGGGRQTGVELRLGRGGLIRVGSDSDRYRIRVGSDSD
jgi:hypothetical protein